MLVNLIEEAYLEEKYASNPKKAQKVADRYLRMNMGKAAEDIFKQRNRNYLPPKKSSIFNAYNYSNPQHVKEKLQDPEYNSSYYYANRSLTKPRAPDKYDIYGGGLIGTGLGAALGAGIGAGINGISNILFDNPDIIDHPVLLGTGMGALAGGGIGLVMPNSSYQDKLEDYNKDLNVKKANQQKINNFNNLMQKKINKVKSKYGNNLNIDKERYTI